MDVPPSSDAVAEAAEPGTVLAERYGKALIQISAALADPTLSISGRVMRARGVIVGLDDEGIFPVHT